ncbi:MAG: DinB family protein [Balneolaceae bacterium]|nr:MAG: DinB family protein [Balneolaceae bacterium]
MGKSYSYHDLRALFENSINQVEKLKTTPPEKLSYKPSEKGWCVGEIVQHLVRFNQLYLRFIGKALSKSDKPKVDQPSFSPRFLMNPFIRFLEPPYKLKIKTITQMKPLNTGSKDFSEDFDELISQNRELIQIIHDAKQTGLNLNGIKGKNSVFMFRMTLTEFILFWDVHQRRHLWQAEQTLAMRD